MANSRKLTESQLPKKALLSLFEKDAKFHKRPVDINSEHGENNEAWFLRMNPKGVVPVLKDGDKVICESDVIVDYVDRNVSGGTSLIPNKATHEGQVMEKLLNLLDNVPYPLLTFGTLLNPEVSSNGIRNRIPGLKMKLEKQVAFMENMMESHPDLKDVYQARIKTKTVKAAMGEDSQKLTEAMANTEVVFEELENALRKNVECGNQDSWLLGLSFTKVDIVFATLLIRLYGLGHDGRFFPQNKRPNVHDYFQRLQKRKSVQMGLAEIAVNTDAL